MIGQRAECAADQSQDKSGLGSSEGCVHGAKLPLTGTNHTLVIGPSSIWQALTPIGDRRWGDSVSPPIAWEGIVLAGGAAGSQ